MKTGTITYNITDRGRKFRGQPRRFDTAGLAAVVNSNEVQERVKHGDLWGYYGHWPRVLFGMNPGEGGVVKQGPLAGKVVRLEPAFVTRSLKADTQGNVTHEAEFADTPTGRTAARLFASKKGGFSSAIDCRPRNGVDVPIGFYGFDYVSEPNFSTNRGYALDGVMEEEGEQAMLDSIAESQTTVRILDGLYTALQADHDRMAETLLRVSAQNDELIALLAEKHPAIVGRLDMVLARDFEPTLRVSRVSSLREMANDFANLPLEPYQVTPEEVSPEVGKLRQILTQFGRR